MECLSVNQRREDLSPARPFLGQVKSTAEVGIDTRGFSGVAAGFLKLKALDAVVLVGEARLKNLQERERESEAKRHIHRSKSFAKARS